MFLIIPKNNETFTYQDLLNSAKKGKVIDSILSPEQLFSFYSNLVSNIYFERKTILVDSDLSTLEKDRLISDLDNDTTASNKENLINYDDFSSIERFMNALKEKNWTLVLFTSGTTGQPKAVEHNLNSFLRSVKISDKHKNKTWALAYNPSHMAGLQVFFQAFFNYNTLVDFFNLEKKMVPKAFNDYKISNISATPTFYRSILPYLSDPIHSVESLTMGGEKYDHFLERDLKVFFPFAKFYNIYASTEAGSILTSRGDNFEIPDRFSDAVKIDNNELLIHSSLLGKALELKLDMDGWYHTGDMVSINQDRTFKFVSRSNELINVGGYKVNPSEVEEEIREFGGILDVLVYSKPNRMLGNLVVADIVLSDNTNALIFEKQLKLFLSNKLQAWKIPRIIYYVESIKTTRTGKKVRK